MIDFCKAGVDCVAMGRGTELSSFILLAPGLVTQSQVISRQVEITRCGHLLIVV